MAIDFSQVKAINIPEGSVTKITDSAGNILWQGVGWHTIWEGSKTCSIKANGNNNPTLIGSEENFAQTAIGTGYTPKIRITFSYSKNLNGSSSSFISKFILNCKWITGEQNSPITIDAVNNDSHTNNVICAPAYDSTSPYGYAGIKKVIDTEHNRIIFNLIAYPSSNLTHNYGAYFKITFTVTKIEQYY